MHSIIDAKVEATGVLYANEAEFKAAQLENQKDKDS